MVSWGTITWEYKNENICYKKICYDAFILHFFDKNYNAFIDLEKFNESNGYYSNSI